ncbi:MAG: sugar phosphate isomerase/epimerase [Chitinophagaceae bacterium]|nr:MAG: sugar phosphate isomerase/epimerase [Chitinophagaceae bacterium]
MRYLLSLVVSASLLLSCGSGPAEGPVAKADDSSGVSSGKWPFGIALWTFHDVDFPTSLRLVDSSGLKYIEPNTFHKAGPELKDSLLGQLSPAGLTKLSELIYKSNLLCRSVYVVGDSTIASWAKQFEIAKTFGATFVTTEPPLKMLDAIDSLAGVYGLKVAIHEHWKGVSEYWNPDTTLAALKNHPNFGVCVDLGHFPKSGIDPLEAVKKFDGRILAIHLKDIAEYNKPELKDVRVGTGVVKFPEIFKELARQKFNGNIYIERDSIEEGGNLISVKETVKYVNEQLNKL